MNLETAVPWAEGGSGRVLKAIDAESGRPVALKLLRSRDPTARERLRREATALSRLAHPNICPILGVIDYDGQPALAMPFIDGERIDRVMPQLDPESRLQLFLQLAGAVAEAHRQGFVHRDLKPGNVLVESREDGTLHVWVLDFGIARHDDDATLTIAGQVQGTPGYMAPEQIDGSRAADARSDIHALGSLLFEAFAGRPPFGDGNVSARMVRAISDDAPRLDHSVPGLPRGLAAVVARCLERDPAHRYPDVHALMADVQAVLEQRPVASRALAWHARIRRGIRRNPRAALGLAATVVVLLGAAGALGWQARTARLHEVAASRLARQLGELAERIESEARLLHSHPTHDITPALARLRADLDKRMSGAAMPSSRDGGARDYALGRALLALGERDPAITHLESAWNAGLHEAPLAIRLAQARFDEYGDALNDALSLPGGELRQSRQLALRRDLQQHLLPLLQVAATGNTEQRAMAAALVAFVEGRIDDALQQLDAAREVSSWPVPYLLLAGNLELDRAMNAVDPGTAPSFQKQAKSYFDAALGYARSSPLAHSGACRTAAFGLDLVNRGALAAGDTLFSPVDDACSTLLAVAPDMPAALLAAADAELGSARIEYERGGDPQARLARVAELSVRALATDPESPAGSRLLGLSRLLDYYWAPEFGRESNQPLSAALDALRQANRARPGDLATIRALAQALHIAGQDAYRDGEDGDALFMESDQLLGAARALPEAPWTLAIDQSRSLVWQGYYRYVNGHDPGDTLDRAVGVLDALTPEQARENSAIRARAYAAWTRGAWELFRGGNPTRWLIEATDAYAQALEHSGESLPARVNRLGALTHHAEWRLRQKQSTDDLLAEMKSELEHIEAISDEGTITTAFWGDYFAFRGETAAQQGRDPLPAFAESRRRIAAAPSSDRFEQMETLARLVTYEHRWRCHIGKPDDTGMQRDLDVLKSVLSDYPDAAEIRAYRGNLLSLAAGCGSPSASETRSAEARSELDRAIREAPALRLRFAASSEPAENI